MLPFEALEELALASAVQVMRTESVFDMTVTHGDVRRLRVGGLCDDRFETASPRQGAGECRMAAKIWAQQCRALHGGGLE